MFGMRLKQGFSLVELAVVLTILGIVIAGGLTLTTAKVRQDKIKRSVGEMEVIDDALAVFLNEYDRLPCPARLDRPRTDPEYGREATDCSDATPPTGLFRVEYPAASGKYIRIGGVPFFSLQIPDEYLADDWQNRYLYAVTEGYITTASTATDDNIEILDDNGTQITPKAVWVLVSHGASKKGGYAVKTGIVAVACDATNKDKENCDNDGVFTDAVFNDGDTPANFFDDFVRWETRLKLYGASSGGGSSSSSGAGLPSCTANQIAKYDGSSWLCAADDVGSSGLPACAVGQVAKYNGASWVCTTIDDELPVCPVNQILRFTGVSWVCTTPTTNIQSNKSCPNGQVLKASGGDFICTSPTVNIQSNKSCPNGQILKASGGDFICTSPTVNIQSNKSCPNGQILKASGGDFVCAVDSTGSSGLPSCVANQIAKYNGFSWLCAADDVGSSGLPTCVANQIAKYNGSSWVCAADDVGSSGLPTCATNEIIKYNGSSWVCTTEAAGGGGAPVPIAFKITTAKTNGSVGGYIGLRNWIQANGCAGYEVCTNHDVLRYAMQNGGPGISIPPGLDNRVTVISALNGVETSGTNQFLTDCSSFNTAASFGHYLAWKMTASSAGSFMIQSCNVSRYVACCKW